MMVAGLYKSNHRLFSARGFSDEEDKRIAESDTLQDAQNSGIEIDIEYIDDEQVIELWSTMSQ